MITTILAVLLWTYGNSASSPDALTLSAFTAEYVKQLKQKKPAAAPEIIGDLHVRSVVDGRTYNTFLDDSYEEYRANVPQFKTILARKIKTALALYSAGITVDINRIVPLIKLCRSLKDSVNAAADSTAGADTVEVVFDDYNDQLVIVYGQDVKTHISYFGPADFNKSCIGRNDLREIAVNNLTQVLPPIKTLDDNGVFMVRAGGVYEASLILCKKFWNRTQFPVKGDLVIALPSKDIVLVAGSKDRAGLKKMSALMEKLYQESCAPFTKDLFVQDSSTGVFRKYGPPAEILAKRKTSAGIAKKTR